MHLNGDESIVGTKTWAPAATSTDTWTPSVSIKNPTSSTDTSIISVSNGGTWTNIGLNKIEFYQSGTRGLQNATSFTVGYKQDKANSVYTGTAYSTSAITCYDGYSVDDLGNKKVRKGILSFPKNEETSLYESGTIATREYVEEFGGKIDVINFNGEDLEITDKTVTIDITEDLNNKINKIYVDPEDSTNIKTEATEGFVEGLQIGSTVLTETQLKKLLDFLDTMEVVEVEEEEETN
jgi:hypothetical protein